MCITWYIAEKLNSDLLLCAYYSHTKCVTIENVAMLSSPCLVFACKHRVKWTEDIKSILISKLVPTTGWIL